jgi:hypothetical protein
MHGHVHNHWIRKRIGPTGRNKRGIFILVDECMCGHAVAVYPEILTWSEAYWLKRLNAREMRHNEQNGMQ